MVIFNFCLYDQFPSSKQTGLHTNCIASLQTSQTFLWQKISEAVLKCALVLITNKSKRKNCRKGIFCLEASQHDSWLSSMSVRNCLCCLWRYLGLKSMYCALCIFLGILKPLVWLSWSRSRRPMQIWHFEVVELSSVASLNRCYDISTTPQTRCVDRGWTETHLPGPDSAPGLTPLQTPVTTFCKEFTATLV